MNIIVERDTLKAGLSAVVGRAKGNSNIPILGHVLIEANGQRVKLTGHDLDSCSVATVPAEVSEAGSIAIPADRLSRLVGGFADGSTIAIKADKQSASVRCGRSNYQFQLMSPDDFPNTLAPVEPIKFTLTAKQVARLFKMPACAIEDSATRPQLSGIYLHRADKRLAACATNGHILIRSLTDATPPEFKPIIIPESACDEISRLSGDEDLAIEISERLIAAEAGNRRFVSKLVDAIFPDYERVVPQATAPPIAFDIKEFDAALARLQNAGDPKKARVVKVSWADNVEHVIASTRTDIGEGSEQVECDCPGRDPGETGANVDYVRSLINALGGHRVRFFIAGPGDPIRIENPDDPDVLAVCMPMRV